MEKGEIAHFEQFHLFPQCFSKAFFFNVLKRVYMGKGFKQLCGYELTICYSSFFCLLTLSQTTNFRLSQIERVCRQF